MLLLVLGANYPLLFIGWEGVGLCSYLLIGFWFSDKANADAGKKAFIVNRIGDFGFLIAMFLLFANLGTLDFAGIRDGASALTFGGPLVTTICLFLFLGCAGKSAQIPLYVWLPDAMAGPTPVSALIHAATMVTAGVYLIARSSVLFSLAPVAQLVVVLIGALTAIFAASIGLKQWDIKKVLAYSTVSQLGYMFVGVGSGAYVAGVFHLVTHAFFKALLFLGSGSVIYAMHAAYHHTGNHDDAQDMRNMGGLKQYLPVDVLADVDRHARDLRHSAVRRLLLQGRDPRQPLRARAVLDARTGAPVRHPGQRLALLRVRARHRRRVHDGDVHDAHDALHLPRPESHGRTGAGVAARGAVDHDRPARRARPLALVGGWLNLPDFASILGPVGGLEHWLDPVVGAAAQRVTAGAPETSSGLEYGLVGLAVLIAAGGIALAWTRLDPARLVPKRESKPEEGFERVLPDKYYVDEIYDETIVKPVVGGSRGLLWRGIDVGVIDGLGVNGSAYLTRFVGWVGSQFQSGRLGTYAWVLVAGVLAVLGAFSIR